MLSNYVLVLVLVLMFGEDLCFVQAFEDPTHNTKNVCKQLTIFTIQVQFVCLQYDYLFIYLITFIFYAYLSSLKSSYFAY